MQPRQFDVAADAAPFDILLLVYKPLIIEGDMDRLQFILGSLQSPEGCDGILDGMLAIAIRSEIENIVHRSASAFPCIDTYMIQTRAMSA